MLREQAWEIDKLLLSIGKAEDADYVETLDLRLTWTDSPDDPDVENPTPDNVVAMADFIRRFNAGAAPGRVDA